MFARLDEHPELASSLILLKSPDWQTTIALYPISTLLVNNNLVVVDGVPHANLERVEYGKEEKVWMIVVEANHRQEERNVVQRAVNEARQITSGIASTSSVTAEDESSFWDGLGICTYEGLGAAGENCQNRSWCLSADATAQSHAQRPTKDLLLSLLPPFPISTFLIDDGWQDVFKKSGMERQLASFGPWEGFGGSLKELVDEIKDRGVKEVGVWLTLQGYWDGIDPTSELATRYACQPHPVGDRHQPRGGVKSIQKGDRVAWLPSPEEAGPFWRDWFAGLKEAGIGFVKVGFEDVA